MIGADNSILNVARAMVGHAVERQAVIAENIAHADTPGYRAKDLETFAETFAKGQVTTEVVDNDAAVKPNGNSVSLESQVMNLAQTRGQHEMGLALWEQTMTLYQTALGRGR